MKEKRKVIHENTLRRLLLAVCVCGCTLPLFAQQSVVVGLEDLDISAFSAGWRKTNRNLSITEKPLSIAGTKYATGLGTHALSEGHIRLDGKKGRFTASVGVDDAAGDRASMVFYVFTNKGTAFNSGLMKKGDATRQIDIELKGITDLYLITDPTADGNKDDYANWVNAVFTVCTAPVAVKDTLEEQRYILTPPPAPKPRINGAKITGASPDKPFLFTIATTGVRPITFTAENLPEGLSLNRETGIITGSCSRTGTYIVPLTAANSVGKCLDTLEIVIGGGLALTPPMGWNTWNIYQLNVTQDIMEKSAQAMYDLGLVNFGYTYVNIDDGWEVKAGSEDPILGGAGRNPDGTIRTNRNFPDIKAMTNYIHRLGLKTGLYSTPGRTTCGGFEGSFGHEAQDLQTFVDWEFDFLKYDGCSYKNEIKSQEPDELKKPYLQMSQLIKAAKRDVILNISQRGTEVWKWGKEAGGNSWRTTGDIATDIHNLYAGMFWRGDLQGQIREYAGPDGWNDPDYLMYGNIFNWRTRKVEPSPYSPSEYYSSMTLWSITSSPLFFSGEITSLDDFTLNVLCNAEVIAINQDKLGKSGYSIHYEALIDIWKKEVHDGSTAIAIFNKRPFDSRVEMDWKALGYTGKFLVRDLWRQKDLGKIQKVTSFDIPRHGCVLLKISK